MMKKSMQFCVLVCIVGWSLQIFGIYIGPQKFQRFFKIDLGWALMLIPALCVIILQLLNREKLLRDLNISFRLNWWFLIAFIVPFVYSFLTLAVSILLPNISFSSNHEAYLSRLSSDARETVSQQLLQYTPLSYLGYRLYRAIIVGIISIPVAFGEELGWRAYLVKNLKNKKLFQASLFIGIVWGIWHFPLILMLGINYPQHPVAGVGMMIIWCVLLTPIMIYFTIKSKSVIPSAIFHAFVNSSGFITIMFIKGGSDLMYGNTGLAGFISLIIVNVTLYLYDKLVTKEHIFTKEIEDY